jgi:hypothetical protein
LRYGVVAVVGVTGEEEIVAKGQPFSVRLEDATEKVVEAEARRTRRSKGAVVEAFTEETGSCWPLTVSGGLA